MVAITVSISTTGFRNVIGLPMFIEHIISCLLAIALITNGNVYAA